MADDLERTQSSEHEETDSTSPHNGPYTVVSKCVAEFLSLMIFVLVGSLQAVTPYDGVLHAALCHGIAILYS